MKKIIIICLTIINTLLTFGVEATLPSVPALNNPENGELPLTPIAPSIPTTGKDVSENGEIRFLEQTFTVMLESKMNVFVPLEVVTDIDIEQNVIGDQIVDIPFEIELNREPEKKDFYAIKYSENLLDIDQDGMYDTYIHSPEYINDRVSKDNFVRIYGGNISKEGTHKKDIYITVEIGTDGE